jgi:hypothetical protein
MTAFMRSRPSHPARDRGQVLDYASWIRTLTTSEIYERAKKFLNKRLVTAYREHSGEVIPTSSTPAIRR